MQFFLLCNYWKLVLEEQYSQGLVDNTQVPTHSSFGIYVSCTVVYFFPWMLWTLQLRLTLGDIFHTTDDDSKMMGLEEIVKRILLKKISSF